MDMQEGSHAVDHRLKASTDPDPKLVILDKQGLGVSHETAQGDPFGSQLNEGLAHTDGPHSTRAPTQLWNRHQFCPKQVRSNEVRYVLVARNPKGELP